MKEIGSEFNKTAFETGTGLKFPIPGSLVLSGRTAIETVLKELPNAKKALLPSYCCDSMIEPFRRANIEIDFYSVNYNNGLEIKLGVSNDIDIVFWCNYFGFKTSMPDLSDYKKRGGVIIEDITHSLYSTESYNKQSNYLIASIRKWEPVYCGGYCAAIDNKLHNHPIKVPTDEFIELKNTAMELKTEYFADLNEEKKTKYLSMFGECNQWLAENYSGLGIDAWSEKYLESIDMIEHRKARKRNAKFLYENLKDVQFLFSESEMDCPLFVPVILQNRDRIQAELTYHGVYCPVHWPHPRANCESNLYKQELSLICDQRYNKEDMEKIVSILQSPEKGSIL